MRYCFSTIEYFGLNCQNRTRVVKFKCEFEAWLKLNNILNPRNIEVTRFKRNIPRYIYFRRKEDAMIFKIKFPEIVEI